LKCYVGLLKTIRTCSTDHTGSIHVNTLRVNTHTHTHTHTYKHCNFKKPVACQLLVCTCLRSLKNLCENLTYNGQLIALRHGLSFNPSFHSFLLWKGEKLMKKVWIDCTYQHNYETHPVYNRHNVFACTSFTSPALK